MLLLLLGAQCSGQSVDEGLEAFVKTEMKNIYNEDFIVESIKSRNNAGDFTLGGEFGVEAYPANYPDEDVYLIISGSNRFQIRQENYGQRLVERALSRRLENIMIDGVEVPFVVSPELISFVEGVYTIDEATEKLEQGFRAGWRIYISLLANSDDHEAFTEEVNAIIDTVRGLGVYQGYHEILFYNFTLSDTVDNIQIEDLAYRHFTDSNEEDYLEAKYLQAVWSSQLDSERQEDYTQTMTKRNNLKYIGKQ